MMIPGSNDFMPIQNASKLSSLPEEGNNRMITPPPPDKKVTLSDEIIDLGMYFKINYCFQYS